MSHLKYPRSVNPELHNVNILALVFTSKLSCIMWKDFLFGLSFRCVMKMDHHCPWINNCCGHTNHAYFTSFLLLAPLGCSHAAIIFIMTMYTQLYERVSPNHSHLHNTLVGILCLQNPIYTGFDTNSKLLFYPLSADIIWLEHRKDWHECRAPVSAHYALQRTCLCCYALCLRLGTGHHYCCWHAFLYTGTWPSRNSFSELTKLSLTNITSDCWYSFFQMKVILRNKTSIESWIEEKVPTLIYIAAHLFQMLITPLSRAFFTQTFTFQLLSPLSTKAKDRIQHYQTGEEFIFPYDLGSRWMNFKRVFTWSGTPTGDGLEWPVHPKCHQHTLTVCLLSRSLLMRLS